MLNINKLLPTGNGLQAISLGYMLHLTAILLLSSLILSPATLNTFTSKRSWSSQPLRIIQPLWTNLITLICMLITKSKALRILSTFSPWRVSMELRILPLTPCSISLLFRHYSTSQQASQTSLRMQVPLRIPSTCPLTKIWLIHFSLSRMSKLTWSISG